MSAPPRIAESPEEVSFECERLVIVEVKASIGAVVLGSVLAIHIKDSEFVLNPERCYASTPPSWT